MTTGYVIPGLQRWSDQYLIDTMGDRPLSVAATPNGYFSVHMKDYRPHHSIIVRYADAVTRNSDGKWYFAEPHYQRMTMKSLLSKLESPSKRLKQNGEYFPMTCLQAAAIVTRGMSIISSRKTATYTLPAILPPQTQRAAADQSISELTSLQKSHGVVKH
jgi:jumonji domain-containing protein 7